MHKELRCEVHNSQLPPWPGRYFVFARVEKLEHDAGDNRGHFLGRDIYQYFSNVHDDVTLKLIQPKMKSGEVASLLNCLIPLGFDPSNIDLGRKYVCDTFSSDEAESLIKLFDSIDGIHGWVQQAYFPEPTDRPLSYFDEKRPNTCGVMDLSKKPFFCRLGFAVYGFYDLHDQQVYTKPNQYRIQKHRLLTIISDPQLEILDEVLSFAENLNDHLWEIKLSDGIDHTQASVEIDYGFDLSTLFNDNEFENLEDFNGRHTYFEDEFEVLGNFNEGDLYLEDPEDQQEMYDNQNMEGYYAYYFDEDYDSEDLEDDPIDYQDYYQEE